MEFVKFSNVCDVYSGYAFKKFNENLEGKPVIKIGNIKVDGNINKSDCSYTNEQPLEKFYSKKDDLYIALSGATTGKVGVMDKEGYLINQRVGVIRRKDYNIPINYIKFFLDSITEKILKDAVGAAQPNISPKDILKYKFPLRTYDEMIKINDILTKINSNIIKCKKYIENLENIVKSQFIEMFMDKNYPYFKMSDLSIGKAEYGAGSASVDYNSFRPRYVRITDINDDGTLNDDYVSSINIDDDEQYKLEYGDFMFARMGATVGKTYAFYEGNQIFAGYLIRFKLNLNKINPRYLFWYTKLEDYDKWVVENQSGAAQPGINAKKYSDLSVPCAPIELQNKFASFVQQIDKSKYFGGVAYA